MTEEDIDLTLAAWARDYAAGKSLPDGFSERLRLSVRHSRRMFRLKLTAIIALVVITTLFAIGLTGRVTAQSGKQTMIAAGEGDAKEECVVGWALLSMFRECFRREKSCKKKEDE